MLKPINCEIYAYSVFFLSQESDLAGQVVHLLADIPEGGVAAGVGELVSWSPYHI